MFGAASADTTSSGTVKASASSNAPSASAEISSGKAIINNFYVSNVQIDYFTVSNITDNPVNVTVVLYRQDGTILTDDGSISGGMIKGCTVGTSNTLLNYSDNNSDSSVTFTLNAHCSGWLCIGNGSTLITGGYGEIKWTQNSSVLHALVSDGIEANSNAKQDISINSGLPF